MRRRKRWAAMHHPFTRPVELGLRGARGRARATAIAKAYDMVLNGSEIGGGSVRIHREEMQSTVFDLLGIAPEEARRKFGFLLDALQVRRAAARRHRLRPGPAGDADGRRRQHPRRDRLPEDPDAPRDPLDAMRRPRSSEAQLRELHIRVRVPPKVE